MVMTPGKSLAPWVLVLDQESHLPRIKNVIKKILKTSDPFYFQLYTTKYSPQESKEKNSIVNVDFTSATTLISIFCRRLYYSPGIRKSSYII